jgi:hypothetical protein
MGSESRSYECAEQQQKNADLKGPLKRMFLVIMATGLIAAGLWLGTFFAAPRRQFRWVLIGGFVMLAGWFAIVFQDELLSSAENASVFRGFSGVSAPCYSGAEDIWIVPIVVPEFELRDV